jgi:uncharacterized protein
VIVYLDTSAFVPLLVEEPNSAACGEAWDSADRLTSTRLTYVEAVVAIGQAERTGRISGSVRSDAIALLDDLWTAVDVIELDEQLMTAAAAVAVARGLRGYDATHCAAAALVHDDDLVAVSGDTRLLTAWRAEGLATWDTND